MSAWVLRVRGLVSLCHALLWRERRRISTMRVVRTIVTKTNMRLLIPRIFFFKFNTLENKHLFIDNVTIFYLLFLVIREEGRSGKNLFDVHLTWIEINTIRQSITQLLFYIQCIYVWATCFDLVGHPQALQENRSKSCLV